MYCILSGGFCEISHVEPPKIMDVLQHVDGGDGLKYGKNGKVSLWNMRNLSPRGKKRGGN